MTTPRAPEELRKLLEHVERDERLGYPPAEWQINAPLALVQVELKAVARVLRWALGETEACSTSAGPVPTEGDD